MFGHAEGIAFFTLGTMPERLLAQLDQRIATTRKPPKKLLKLRPLYLSDGSKAFEGWSATHPDRVKPITQLV